ncbi:MAG TPA: hypothetical protein VHO23_02695 [Candidatus Paceibacterota bacterium]|nr:hypothetical protein [Candidatus Paceibacterota bacterium]
MAMRVLSTQAALELLKLRPSVVHILAPREVKLKQHELATATRNAELFYARTGQIDHGMIQDVTELRLQLDTLIGEWAERRVEGVI